MSPSTFTRIRRPLVLTAGAATLAAAFAIGVAPSASAATSVKCTDDSRSSAADVAKAESNINETNTVDSKDSNGRTLATIKLRYSPTYHCGWGLIQGHSGDTVWIDRWRVPQATWQGPLAQRNIQSGNATTYTAAFNVPGYSIRACGVAYASGHKAGTLVCTAWQSESTLDNQPGSGTGESGNTSGPSQQATHPAADDGIVGDMFADSSQVDCATGTKSVGIFDGYNLSATKITRVRLCQISNLPTTPDAEETTPGYGSYINGADGHAVVNARISGQVLKMVQAANNSGVQLQATSSFRTMPHQQHLYDCYIKHEKGCNLAAPPGKSNHQMGLALDFNYLHSSSTCSGGNASQNSMWKWLNKNGGSYGFRQLYAENWHWDTTNLSRMCG